MDKKFVDKVIKEVDKFESRCGYSATLLSFKRYLRDQVKPEWPCPVCGDEMLRIGDRSDGVYARCVTVDCPIATTERYSSTDDLKEALRARKIQTIPKHAYNKN